MTDPSLAQALFNPRAVALIGASADPTKNNSRAQRLLLKAGYAGRVVPINPGRAEIMGVKAFPTVRDAPGPIDHAFIMVPAAAVPDAIASCGEAGVKVATIFSAGFAEIGEAGLALQQRIVATAATTGLRILGPNCLGLVNVTGGVPLSVNAAIEAEILTPGWISVVSQSGSMMGALMTRIGARGLGFSKLVSVGNECDLGVGELAVMLVEDPDTRVVLLFLETFRDADRLAEAARHAHVLGKAVIAYKLGRSEVGRRIAASHTGAMVGGDELAAAFFRAHGIMRVDTLEGLVELPRLIVGRTPPSGNRVAVLTGTGGAAAMVVDRLGTLGDQIVPPPPDMRARLGADGIEVSDSPLIDLPMGGTKGQYPAVLAELAASGHCDAIVAVLGSTVRLRPNYVDDVILAVDTRHKPVAVFVAPLAEPAHRLLEAAGIAGFRTPETCADAVHAYLAWRRPDPPVAVAADLVQAADASLVHCRPGALDEAQACAVFARLGIEVPESRIVTTPDDVTDSAVPVAVKLLSPDILHKTDAGLVRLNLIGRAAVAGAVGDLLAIRTARFPTARLTGVLIAPMQRGVAEIILGFRRDPEIGPVVVLGIGGVMAELKRSFCVRLAPVDEATAQAMIAELPELRMIAGYRGLPRGDLAALARAIRALSMLACLEDAVVHEAEINPLIVRGEGEGVVAVDGLVTFSRSKDVA